MDFENARSWIFYNYLPAALKELSDPQKQELYEKKLAEIRTDILSEHTKNADFIIERVRTLRAVPFIQLSEKVMERLKEALTCYVNGLDYATIIVVGGVAESITLEIIDETDVRFNGTEIHLEQKKSFETFSQEMRIDFLSQAKRISPEVAGKLHEIRKKRNDYIHPKRAVRASNDSMNMLNLLIDILSLVFPAPEEGIRIALNKGQA